MALQFIKLDAMVARNSLFSIILAKPFPVLARMNKNAGFYFVMSTLFILLIIAVIVNIDLLFWIVLCAFLLVITILFFRRFKNGFQQVEEDNYLDNMLRMPTRFSYEDLKNINILFMLSSHCFCM